MASFEPASSIGGHYERLAKPSSREILLQISWDSIIKQMEFIKENVLHLKNPTKELKDGVYFTYGALASK